MKKIILLAAVAVTGLFAFSQTPEYRKMTLSAKIREMDGSKTKYFVHSSSDSAIRVMDFDGRVNSDVNPARLHQIEPALIRSIGLRRKNQVWRGAGLGILSGMIVGGFVGLASYQEPHPDAFFDFGPGLSALAGSMVGGVLGGLTGIVVTIPTKKHRINGKKENFQVFHKALNQRIKRKGKA